MNFFNKALLNRSALGIITLIIILGILPSGVAAGSLKKQINTTIFGVAIKGYDTVAYFTENRAVKGNREFSHEWNDARWYFSSARNRDLFVGDPDRYAPKYGGY